MVSEHESAVEAWLENADTKAELRIIRQRFHDWDEFEVVMFAVAMEILVHLEMPTLTVVDGEDAPGVDEKPGWMGDDDEGEEPWKRRT